MKFEIGDFYIDPWTSDKIVDKNFDDLVSIAERRMLMGISKKKIKEAIEEAKELDGPTDLDSLLTEVVNQYISKVRPDLAATSGVTIKRRIK